MNRIYKIALYGDSLSCPRKGIVRSDKRYLAQLENFIRKKRNYEFIEIRDRARGGVLISQLWDEYEEDNTYYDLPGNVLILHSGIVDCAPRPIAPEQRNRLSRLPAFIRKPIINYIHKNRAKLLRKNGGGFVNTTNEKYKEVMERFLKSGCENYEYVFVITICPTNSETASRSPGLPVNISLYNTIIKETVQAMNKKNLFLVDVNGMICANETAIDDFIVKADGHHIHEKTHTWIAEQIVNTIHE